MAYAFTSSYLAGTRIVNNNEMDIGIERKKKTFKVGKGQGHGVASIPVDISTNNNIINIFVVLTHLKHVRYFYTKLCNISKNTHHVI